MIRGFPDVVLEVNVARILILLWCLGGAWHCLAASELSLEQAMADPDWIGQHVESPYFSIAGDRIFYQRKRAGSNLRDTWSLDLASGESSLLDDDRRDELEGGDWVLSSNGQRATFTRDGDLYVRQSDGTVRQLTRSPEREERPAWMSDGRIMVRRGNDWWIAEPDTGLVYPAAQLRFQKAPGSETPTGLAAEELRLIATLRRAREDEQAQREQLAARARARPENLSPPIYLPEKWEQRESALSPDGRWLLLVVFDRKAGKGTSDKMPRYVAHSGYVEIDEVRTLVGRDAPLPEQLLLVDLQDGSHRQLDLGVLPDIRTDPLADLRAAADQRSASQTSEKTGKSASRRDRVKPEASLLDPRPLQVVRMLWNASGERVAVQLRSQDNKDRWIATLDPQNGTLEPLDRLHDPAWINWDFNDLGWLPDQRTLWFLSERTGYAHLYLQAPGERSARALSSGDWEVLGGSITPSRDGRYIYFSATPNGPFTNELYRVPVEGEAMEVITGLGGSNDFALSADQSQLLALHGTSYMPPQLVLQDTMPQATARILLDTRSEAYKAFEFQAPELLWYASTHGDFQVPAKFYPARGDGAGRGAAVVFVHGAGYLQDVHAGYPVYFREQMFHNLLSEQGVAVLVPDFRASKGYGRAWRTAIYRQMGTPELEDLQDGVRWLVEQRGVDPARVGVYGGSYGGFMTMMAMFKSPETFAAGAALRPVTDWSHYNHGYTSNILNTPQLDPEAYLRSSPIEHAAGLSKPLLISHGMLDDNVFYKDSVRLVQRLIELRKGEHFELASYPLERHSFVQSDAWYDQYLRIWKLFRRELHF